MSKTLVKKLSEILVQNESAPDKDWQIRIFSHDDCLSYLVWNEAHSEGILIDPKRECVQDYINIAQELPHMMWLAVIDTHTHADHISAAAEMAGFLKAPLIMHHKAPSQRVHLRVSHQTQIPTHSGVIELIQTPGHTSDGLCVTWGPFVFTGDTVLFGDVGRDDLPTGSPEDHYESLQALRNILNTFMIVCPGHDNKGGRISSWGTQLKINASLTQERESFITESTAFSVAAPALFKESLLENFK